MIICAFIGRPKMFSALNKHFSQPFNRHRTVIAFMSIRAIIRGINILISPVALTDRRVKRFEYNKLATTTQYWLFNSSYFLRSCKFVQFFTILLRIYRFRIHSPYYYGVQTISCKWNLLPIPLTPLFQPHSRLTLLVLSYRFLYNLPFDSRCTLLFDILIAFSSYAFINYRRTYIIFFC